MKNEVMIGAFLFALTAILLPTSVIAALLSDNGFLNIPWGSTRQQIADNMAQRKEFKLVSSTQTYINTSRLDGFANIKFEGNVLGYPALIKFRFLNNIFYEGQITYQAVQPENSTDQLQSGFSIDKLDSTLRGQMIEKFGLPQVDETNDDSKIVDEMYRGKHSRWFLIGRGDNRIIIDYQVVFPYNSSKYQYEEDKKHGVIIVTYTNQNLRTKLLQSKHE